jgi:hypothetical protein
MTTAGCRRNTIIEVLNEMDPVVTNLALMAELSPLVNESPERGRLAIELLEIMADYISQLEALSDAMAQNARE